MTRAVVCLFLTLCLAVPTVAAEDTNYCHDPARWADWNERVKKRPDDTELHTLHALWLGLCVKVERGDLSHDEASLIFEQARHAFIRQRQQENDATQKAAPL